jgi:hypothetical protein
VPENKNQSKIDRTDFLSFSGISNALDLECFPGTKKRKQVGTEALYTYPYYNLPFSNVN